MDGSRPTKTIRLAGVTAFAGASAALLWYGPKRALLAADLRELFNFFPGFGGPATGLLLLLVVSVVGVLGARWISRTSLATPALAGLLAATIVVTLLTVYAEGREQFVRRAFFQEGGAPFLIVLTTRLRDAEAPDRYRSLIVTTDPSLPQQLPDDWPFSEIREGLFSLMEIPQDEIADLASELDSAGFFGLPSRLGPSSFQGGNVHYLAALNRNGNIHRVAGRTVDRHFNSLAFSIDRLLVLTGHDWNWFLDQEGQERGAD